MSRIMGLDYGDKTVGVAVSDPFMWTAQGLETITRTDKTNLKPTLERLKVIIETYEVTKIILGNPLHMHYEAGERSNKSGYFKKKLEVTFGLEVILQDERLSTKSAVAILDAGGVQRKDQKKVVDKVAASIILQHYLDGIAH